MKYCSQHQLGYIANWFVAKNSVSEVRQQLNGVKKVVTDVPVPRTTS